MLVCSAVCKPGSTGMALLTAVLMAGLPVLLVLALVGSAVAPAPAGKEEALLNATGGG
jgi:hypothetical protein